MCVRLLTNIWILFRYNLLQATSPSDFGAGLVMWALFAHFRRLFLLLLFLVITVLAIYPLVSLAVPCLTGILLAQMCVIVGPTCWTLFVSRQYRVVMRLLDTEVAAATIDKKER